MVTKRSSVLVVDDEPVVCDVLYDDLRERGYRCATALDGQGALAKLAVQDFDAVLLDIRLPGMSGMDVLREIWLNHDNMATIMVTAVDDVATAVEAMRLGASDYIVKPFDLDAVDVSIRTALEERQATCRTSSEMDAIAGGVEARIDPFFAYSKIVTERTAKIACRLGFSETEIQRWAASRTRFGLRKTIAGRP